MVRLRWLFVLLSLPRCAQACTTVALGKKATADGSTIATFNVDSSQLDSRMAYIPPQDHAAGTMRPVYYSDGNFPRYVGVRSKTYAASSVPGVDEQKTKPIGHIPQVRHTYGYWEACYGFMNEKGLGFGESTTYGKIFVAALGAGGTALFGIDGLMQLALERCDSARCAIETMGHWGKSEGFYGESPDASDAGEVLSVVDGNEAWVFHIMADFDGGAVWAAQRVPEHHAAVTANNFIIRGIDFTDDTRKDYMWSEGILDVSRTLVKQGKAPSLCDSDDTFDFLKCFGADLRKDAYYPGYGPLNEPNPWYTTLRMWRVQNLLAPSLGHQPTNNAFDLPFSFPVDKPVSLLQAMDIQRDQYRGTPYDLTKGALAGPHGDPNRDEGGDSLLKVHGYYPRGISLIRTSYSLVCHSKVDGPDIAWIAMHQPATSVFVPFFAEAHDAHESYLVGYQGEYQRKSAWWVFSFVSNWMRLDWASMYETFVSPKLRDLQAKIVSAAAKVTQDFTQEQKDMQGKVVQEWTALGDFLIMAYNNGYLNSPNIASKHGYPESWLQAIGFRHTLEPLLVQPAVQGPVHSPVPYVENLAGARPAENFSQLIIGFLTGSTLVVSLFAGSEYLRGRKKLSDPEYRLLL